ncbi:MAG: glycosyltransferase [Candidatus Marinimicrobia bacterium]|jgi:cellulose synthase/poly-beta-1,6-N-acetylglucosamine synthase-like glycosyltransferase|nr:glycosyltransferase [Candidatus Neomarinimicrobiota bacterium]MBT4851021.1 glycosyltransferase [Candidatus Neomarinimicrobiota bacterium]MBT6713623.1 glycosyltransferase [Candidatus Neomarinimicrobiota bacterium]MBT7021618.1 glycosyltransferase [Candidatus Neomarinimicrobiota bacterium]MBT7884651.1 glycosyltransferase [Candidatus Neomarinimicrobiota bacterium]
MSIIEIVFWMVVFSIVYTYFGFPLALLLKKKKRKCRTNPSEFPSVTLIITAYNEETHIVNKLKNSLELDYPPKKLQIILANDGSTDNTSELVKKFNEIELLELVHRGKTSAQNKAVTQSTGDIIVFSDANNIYKIDAVKKLVLNFSEISVGAVCGELCYNGANTKEGLYWKYEVFLKKLESRSGQLLGVNGSIYAIRKKLYQKLAEDAISDFIEPVLIYGAGHDVIYEPTALAFEDEPNTIFDRKRRIILRTLYSLKYVRHLMNPFQNRNIFMQLFSHKILRWFMPLLLLCLFLLNIVLLGNGILYNIIFVLQLIFYLSAFVVNTVRYFLIVNFAALMAIWDWVCGKKIVTWAVNRD